LPFDHFQAPGTKVGRQNFLRVLVWRGGVDGKRVNTTPEFAGQEIVDEPMAHQAALPFESIRYNINSKVRFFSTLMPGMAGMLIGLVEHPQADRRKGLGQLLRDGFLHARHRGLTQVMDAFTPLLL
jgi:hypothetical protein